MRNVRPAGGPTPKFHPHPSHVVLGVGRLKIAAYPAGFMATFYSYLARANVALSVSLTAVSCLAAVLTLPILLMSFQAYLGEPATFAVPVPVLLRQLLLTLMAPVLMGMAFRRL